LSSGLRRWLTEGLVEAGRRKQVEQSLGQEWHAVDGALKVSADQGLPIREERRRAEEPKPGLMRTRLAGRRDEDHRAVRKAGGTE
jgi:hypothetical protein